MHRLNTFILAVFIVAFASACDPSHQSEFNRIDRTDIEGYEQFISLYPDSPLVVDAQERIEAEKEARLQRQLESQYGSNSLSNESAPYTQWYGRNLYFDEYTPHSEIQVQAPSNSDVIVIVRYNNQNGNVAGHKYIKKGCTGTIYLKNDYNYQTFFYYGNGWYPQKEMKNGVKGGFIKGESFSKDGSPSYLDNNILTYQLTLQTDGNFSTSASNEGEMF